MQYLHSLTRYRGESKIGKSDEDEEVIVECRGSAPRQGLAMHQLDLTAQPRSLRLGARTLISLPGLSPFVPPSLPSFLTSYSVLFLRHSFLSSQPPSVRSFTTYSLFILPHFSFSSSSPNCFLTLFSHPSLPPSLPCLPHFLFNPYPSLYSPFVLNTLLHPLTSPLTGAKPKPSFCGFFSAHRLAGDCDLTLWRARAGLRCPNVGFFPRWSARW